jgi:hypothetical protein
MLRSLGSAVYVILPFRLILVFPGREPPSLFWELPETVSFFVTKIILIGAERIQAPELVLVFRVRLYESFTL